MIFEHWRGGALDRVKMIWLNCVAYAKVEQNSVDGNVLTSLPDANGVTPRMLLKKEEDCPSSPGKSSDQLIQSHLSESPACKSGTSDALCLRTVPGNRSIVLGFVLVRR